MKKFGTMKKFVIVRLWEREARNPMEAYMASNVTDPNHTEVRKGNLTKTFMNFDPIKITDVDWWTRFKLRFIRYEIAVNGHRALHYKKFKNRTYIIKEEEW